MMNYRLDIEFKELFEAIPAAVLLVDVAGNVLGFNRNARVLFGFDSVASSGTKGVDCVEDLLLLNQEDTRTVYYCGPSFFFNCSTLDGFLEAEKYFSQLRHGFAAKA